MNKRLTAFAFVLVVIVSCQPKQETLLAPQLKLSIDEVKMPIPDDMTNDWGFSSASSFENGERLLHVYDVYRKEIIQYSLDQEKLLKKISPFSDTLDPGDSPVFLFIGLLI